MRDAFIKKLIRSYGIDLENEDDFIVDLKTILGDCFIHCPTCGESDNLHENINYHNPSEKPEILCNECGQYFNVEPFNAKDGKDYTIEGLKIAAAKWRKERDEALIELSAAQSRISELEYEVKGLKERTNDHSFSFMTCDVCGNHPHSLIFTDKGRYCSEHAKF